MSKAFTTTPKTFSPGQRSENPPLLRRLVQGSFRCRRTCKAVIKQPDEAEHGSKILALKEWAAIVAALGRGHQTVLVRKGGIREAGFDVSRATSDFLLFPTAFHSDGALLKPSATPLFEKDLVFDPKKQPELVLHYSASITGAWTSLAPDLVEALTEFHILGPEFLSKRMKWKPRQPLTVLELRCYQLDASVVLPQSEEYYGCFSWVPLSNVPGDLPAKPVIPTADFRDRQARLRQALSALNAQEIRMNEYS